MSLRTLSIAGADLRLLDTGHHWSGVGDESKRTAALGSVVYNLALCVGTTSSGTGVSAPVVDTSVGLGTI